MDNALSLVVTMSLKDMISNKLNKIGNGFQELKKNIPTNDVKKLESSLSGMKWGAGFMTLAGGMANFIVKARMETSKLEANTRSLGKVPVR